MRTAILLTIIIACAHAPARSDSGYRLWLRYDLIADAAQRSAWLKTIRAIHVAGSSPTTAIIRKEIDMAMTGLLGSVPAPASSLQSGMLIIALADAPILQGHRSTIQSSLSNLGSEGFAISSPVLSGKKVILITANTDTGLLYGTFNFLRLLQTGGNIDDLSITSRPQISIRILNHWDNLDRTVERGYAGFSLWDWHKLPDHIDPRYHDYARANASLGINATVLTNVNANALILTPMYLEKVKALADVFRPYGIRVYLTARFSAPIEIGGLKTADPLDASVQQWWNEKVSEVYRYVPDFGGFVVKANSEGQPGPQNYNRSHADGANMLADAVKPFKGIVMWRAFVYDNNVPVDRTKQAYNEFKPLDGKFRDNVVIQIKNGPLDFQPREPFHPLFGAMTSTAIMPEFQITQEYLGFSTHLVYLAPLFRELLDADTYSKGKGSTVAKIIQAQPITAMAGVTNIGNDQNWTGHHFGQANWYAFGRLAWDPSLTAEEIAGEWIRMTFSNDKAFVNNIASMMIASREITVNYMTPLGLHHIMGWSHHYGPAPWIKDRHRADWTSVYYHKADSAGIGFNRSSSGSNALEQYFPPVRTQFENEKTCPEKYLLWFHHASWDRPMKSGRTLWEELCLKYQSGVDSAGWMVQTWERERGKVDKERADHIASMLAIQHKEAKWWRDACLLYFQTFSRRPFPAKVPKPDKTLDQYQSLSFPYAPGIKPQW